MFCFFIFISINSALLRFFTYLDESIEVRNKGMTQILTANDIQRSTLYTCVGSNIAGDRNVLCNVTVIKDEGLLQIFYLFIIYINQYKHKFNLKSTKDSVFLQVTRFIISLSLFT